MGNICEDYPHLITDGCGRSGPASIVMINQHAFTVMCLLFINKFQFLSFYLSTL